MQHLILQKSLRKIIKAKIFILLLFAFFPVAARALSVSPALREFSLDPGESRGGAITIRNNESENLVIELLTKNFESANDQGAARPSDLPEDLASWISFREQTFALKKGQEKKVTYQISVPANASPGEHFAGILVRARPANTDAAPGTELVNEIASLVLTRVSGDIVEQGTIKEFFVIRQYSFPTTFRIRFENSGNVFLKPYGTIRITDWFGNEVATLSVNDAGGSVLSKSGRSFDVSWENEAAATGVKKIFFGRYRAELEMFYGTEKKNISSLHFWLINRTGIITAIIITGIIVFGLWRIIAKVHKRKFFIERI